MEILNEVMEKITSKDATERFRGVGELGEIGTEKHGDVLKKITWEDESSTIQQVAIQAYIQVMGEKGFDELIKVIDSHPDEYVVQHAILTIAELPVELGADKLAAILKSENNKYRTAALRSMILLNLSKHAKLVYELLQTETFDLAIQNCIEALALWKYKKAKDEIIKYVHDKDIETRTIALFALAVFGDKQAKQRLESEEVDEYRRIRINGERFVGRKGLLAAIKKIK